MKKKVYYRIEFELTSALNIGCGENKNSDSDVLKNSKGLPYIPGSALAGIYRSVASGIDAIAAKVDDYFGTMEIIREINPESKPRIIESVIKVYDANVIENSKLYITKRDCVGLDEFKTAKAGAKFDFEVVEPGVTWVTYIEQDLDESKSEDIGKSVVSYWKKNGLSIGSKTMRGLGETKIKNIGVRIFDLEQNLDDWLDFDMYANESWNEFTEEISIDSSRNSIVLTLEQKSGISVRKYSTAVNRKSNLQADYAQLTTTDNGVTKPVIPGTTWAGAFGHQMEQLLGRKEISLFGSLSKKSEIMFSESIINDACDKVITRNAIDRFAGGTVDGALYTEKSYFGGNTELKITLPKASDKAQVRALVAAIFDLHFGYMAIGGLTSVGRGLFAITKAEINGITVEIPVVTDDGTVPAFEEWIGKLA